MKNTKEVIIEKARALFNKNGVANVSVREIARELGISHSNLLYYYENKNALIASLHNQLLKHAVDIYQHVKNEPPLPGLFISTIEGFKVLYEYRFFMLDMVWILRENKKLHAEILEIEKLRFKMYEEKIEQMASGEILLRSVDRSNYAILIDQIRVISDAWLTSAHIYSTTPKATIKKYATLLLFLFYPYLTDRGKQEFKSLCMKFDIKI